MWYKFKITRKIKHKTYILPAFNVSRHRWTLWRIRNFTLTRLFFFRFHANAHFIYAKQSTFLRKLYVNAKHPADEAGLSFHGALSNGNTKSVMWNIYGEGLKICIILASPQERPPWIAIRITHVRKDFSIQRTRTCQMSYINRILHT